MENNNKPQWLIDAENEINNAANTKYGKMTDKEFRFSQHQSYANKCANDKMKADGFDPLASIRTKEHQSNAGKAALKVNIESGHQEVFRQAGSIACGIKYENERIEKLKSICNVMEVDKFYTKNFNTSQFTGSQGICNKYNWATNTCNVSWDGITYGVSPPDCST